MTLNFVYFLTTAIFSIVELLIGVRVVLKLFGASAMAPFVAWVYETTGPLLTPFAGVFPNPQISGGFVLEFSALFALIVYALAGYLVSNLISGLIAQEGKRGKRKERE